MTREELIAALEKATGPSRAMDAELWWLADERASRIAFWNAAAGMPRPLPSPDIPPGLGRLAVETCAPRYTESIDAALTLVPEGCGCQVGRPLKRFVRGWYASVFMEFDDGCGVRHWSDYDNQNDVVRPKDSYRATPALALCIASLKARG